MVLLITFLILLGLILMVHMWRASLVVFGVIAALVIFGSFQQRDTGYPTLGYATSVVTPVKVEAPQAKAGHQWVCRGPNICKWMSDADCDPRTRYTKGLIKFCNGKQCAFQGRSDTCDPRPAAPALDLEPGKIFVCDDGTFTRGCRYVDAKLWKRVATKP